MSFNENELSIISLVDHFISGGITAPDFEKEYIKLQREYRDSSALNGENEGTQIFFDNVFYSVDSYCSDPELMDEDDLNAEELLNEITQLKQSWMHLGFF